MATYHITGNGEVGFCRAESPASCPFGSRGGFHADDRERTEAVAEILNEHDSGYCTTDGVFFWGLSSFETDFFVDSEGDKHYVMNSLISGGGEEGLKKTVANSINNRMIGRDPRYGYQMTYEEINDRVDLDALVAGEAREIDGSAFIPYKPDDLPDKHRKIEMERTVDLAQKYTRNAVDILYRAMAKDRGEEYDREKHGEPDPDTVRSQGFEKLREKKRQQISEYESLGAKRVNKAREIKDKAREILYPERLGVLPPSVVGGQSFEQAMNNDTPIRVKLDDRLFFYQVDFIKRGNISPWAGDDGYETPEQLFHNDKQVMEEAKQLKPMIEDYKVLSERIEKTEKEMAATDLDYRDLSRDAVEYFSHGDEDKAKEYRRYFGIE